MQVHCCNKHEHKSAPLRWVMRIYSTKNLEKYALIIVASYWLSTSWRVKKHCSYNWFIFSVCCLSLLHLAPQGRCSQNLPWDDIFRMHAFLKALFFVRNKVRNTQRRSLFLFAGVIHLLCNNRCTAHRKLMMVLPCGHVNKAYADVWSLTAYSSSQLIYRRLFHLIPT